MTERIWLYDTTLRDGAQTQGVDFGVEDKLRIAAMLDRLGVAYIEGGWPGANPTDDAFFQRAPTFRKGRLCAFGMTRRPGRSAANDPALAPILRSTAPVVTLVGKTARRHAEGALGAEADENLRMIAESLVAAGQRAEETIFDAEHFFDGWKEDSAYALACLEAAVGAGVRWVVLCDTNGGSLPHEVAEITAAAAKVVPVQKLGIHAHNDTENAVANSLAAVREGVRHVQGTINGLGERCGNANLIALVPTLMVKMGFDVGIDETGLRQLTPISRTFDEQLNRTPNRQAAYVGASAFAHKAGLHASAVAKDPVYYEHIDPARVGNAREIVVSDQAGRSNLVARFAEFGLDVTPDADQTAAILQLLKEREAQGHVYDGAAASFELLVRRSLGQVPVYFDLLSFRIIDERRFNARGELVTLSEATIKLAVGEDQFYTVADGNGPINALDHALRQALVETYPTLEAMRLLDYKVRILPPRGRAPVARVGGEARLETPGTDAVTRVIIESGDDQGRVWQTVGLSGNIIDASYNALQDAITYKLFLDRAAGQRVRAGAR